MHLTSSMIHFFLTKKSFPIITIYNITSFTKTIEMAFTTLTITPLQPTNIIRIIFSIKIVSVVIVINYIIIIATIALITGIITQTIKTTTSIKTTILTTTTKTTTTTLESLTSSLTLEALAAARQSPHRLSISITVAVLTSSEVRCLQKLLSTSRSIWPKVSHIRVGWRGR